jgi:hypothetical protein
MAMALDKVRRVEPVAPTPNATHCKHSHWRIYNSLGYRECDECRERRPIFNDIRHQR